MSKLYSMGKNLNAFLFMLHFYSYLIWTLNAVYTPSHCNFWRQGLAMYLRLALNFSNLSLPSAGITDVYHYPQLIDIWATLKIQEHIWYIAFFKSILESI
jgi:hypothetical protein